MKIQVVPYDLIPRGNAGAPRQGALLKVYFNSGHSGDAGEFGYSDCHPWPELGDLPLSSQLELLKKDPYHPQTPLLQRSLAFAQKDAEARARGVSLGGKVKVPLSHFLVTNLKQLDERILEEAASQGFQILKLKVGRVVEEEAQLLVSLSPLLKQLKLKLRLDFNARVKREVFESFLEKTRSVHSHIDFIEDPFAYDPLHWSRIQKEWGIRLALDRVSEEVAETVVPESFSIWVIKPAVQDPHFWIQRAQKLKKSVVMTSYLDHPLGQLSAAWIAGQILEEGIIPIETCGFLSHSVYEETPFSIQLRARGPGLLFPPGTGFGMDELLARTFCDSMELFR